MKPKLSFIIVIIITAFPSLLLAQDRLILETVSADEVIEKLNKGEDVYYENTLIKGELDFTKVDAELVITDRVESIDIDKIYSNTIYIDSEISFIDCVFEGEITTYRKEKRDNYSKNVYKIIFEEKITFLNSEFKSRINFFETVFMKNINMYKSLFKDIFISERARYMSDVIFGAIYDSNVDFSEVLFQGKCSYINSVFNSKADFSDTLFVSVTDFTGSLFKDEVDFNWARFLDEVYFYEAIFKKFVDFSNVSFSKSQPIFSLTVFESGFVLKEVKESID